MDYEIEIRIPYEELTKYPCSKIEDIIVDRVSEGLHYYIHKRLSLLIITPYSTKDVSCEDLTSYINDSIDVDCYMELRYNRRVYKVTGKIVPYPSANFVALLLNVQ